AGHLRRGRARVDPRRRSTGCGLLPVRWRAGRGRTMSQSMPDSRGTVSRNGTNGAVKQGQTLLEVEHLQKFFPIKRGFLQKTIGAVRAVDDVSFTITKGETLALVG